MEDETQTDSISGEIEMKVGSESEASMEYVRVDCANETEADLEEGKQDVQNQCISVEDHVSDDIGNSENAAPISLDAISSAEVPVVVKSSEQEVINMLLAQHGILPSGTALEDMGLPTMVRTAATSQESLDRESARTDGRQSNELQGQVEAHNAAYLSSITAPEIVTTYVAEDGQGGHIIISGGQEYQDNGVVAISGQQVSTISEGQLMTIASGENAPVSIAALDSFTSDHVHMASGADDEGAGTATSYYVLEDHVAMVDGQNHMDGNDQEASKKIYQCAMDGCGKQFSTPYRLKAHGRSHTGQTFSCDEDGCHKTFITPSDLNKHSRTHSGDKPFFCDYDNCGKVYSTAHHLKVHKRSHTGDKPFICEWETCGKSFSTGYGLKSHFRTHTGERPYKCPDDSCDKAFKTSGDLQKHVRTHTGERPFTCPYEGCSRSFTTSNIRKVHMRTHTGERPYVCEIEGCTRSFASATNYKNHSRIHTGERPYSCEVPGCNKSFTEYSSLYKHNVVHTQQKPYICSICHKTYRQTSTLAMHKRTVHGTAEECMAENAAEEHSQDGEPASKRQKVAYDSNVALTTALVQGLPVMLNDEGTMNALQTHYAELAAQQQITDGSALSGAIAIPIQVTMNPDGTIAGAHGINLTDSSGRIIPVSLSLSLPISSFANSLTTSSQTEESIVSSEAVAAASAVNEIFTNQQSEASIDVQLSSGQVITEQIENTDVIAPQDEHAELKETYENDPMIATEGLNSSQILITTVSDTHALMTSDSDATTVRIAPRDYSSNEAEMKNIDRPEGDDANNANSNIETREEGAVSMIIGEDIAREHDEGDVTDRYLIKEGFEVRERETAKVGHQV